MRIVSLIEDQEVIRTILQHLGLWDIRSRLTAKGHAPPALAPAAARTNDRPPQDIYGDPQDPWEAYI
jgi:hypothetical protein